MTYHVLIVDDSSSNLLLSKGLVGKLQDCVAHGYTHAQEALEWMRNHQADLLIVDYMMPELNGIEFIARVRQMRGCEHVPILMVTGNNERPVRYAALDAGANDFLTKPVDSLEFLARVRNMLALSMAHRKLSNHADWLADEVRAATAEIRSREKDTVVRLCRAAEFRDPETGAHLMRMARYSRLIGKGIGLTGDELDLLEEAAPMHDIGKVGITDNVLLKPGRFTPHEFDQMKLHAKLGHDLLVNSTSRVLQAGAQIALGHHEKWNGTGYPQGLAGEQIPVFCRVVAVADVFDALTSVRPYKPAWTLQAAADLLRQGSGIDFDPACVDALFAAWDEVLQIKERYRDD